MATVGAGEPVRDFTLPDINGQTRSTVDARRQCLLLFVFFKKSCPVCQLIMPYLQRLHDIYAGADFQVWGVSQNGAEETEEFAERFGTHFPLLVDTALDVTELYDITSVPSLYLTDSSGLILRYVSGFSTKELNSIAALAAERADRPRQAIVREEENVPSFKPG